MTTEKILTQPESQAHQNFTLIHNFSNLIHQKEKQVKFICPEDKDLEVIKVGPAVITILEDGTHTDNRFGAVKVSLGPKMPGPVPMWHRMNDTTFYIIKGRLRFFISSTYANKSSSLDNSEDKNSRIVKAGDYVVVPPCAIHNFENPFDEEAVILNTFTPAYYIDAIRTIARKTQKAIEEGRYPLSPEEQQEVMSGWATFPPPVN